MIYLYQILSVLAAVPVLPGFAVYALFSRHKKRHLPDHFGFLPAGPGTRGEESGRDRKILWWSALSLGEVTASVPVLQRIHHQRPEVGLVVSVTTDSGYEAATQHLPFAERIVFQPLDCLPFNALALARLQPRLYVLADTGFWPGLLHLLERRGVPALLFNGRLSKRSLRRYRMLGGFATRLFRRFALLCMQNESGREAVISLGVDPERVRVIGDPKYDAVRPVSEADRVRLRERLGIGADPPVWVAGSTHAGEEDVVLDVYRQLKEKFPDLVLLLAPRRLERLNEVKALIQDKNLPCTLRSRIGPGDSVRSGVVLLDTLGELAELYAVADAAFVGRSLRAPGGGHSLIEPLAHGTPVLHGPYIHNFRHVAEAFRDSGAALEVASGEALQRELERLFSDEALRRDLAARAVERIEAQRGAAQRMADLVLDALKD